MELILIDFVRYFISGLFSFSIFNNSKNSIIKRVIVPSVIYTLLLVIFKTLIADSPIILFISVIPFFVYLICENNFKMYQFSLTFSLFIVCILECTHFLIFEVLESVRNILKFFNMYNKDLDSELLIPRIIIVVLYVLALFLIYKLNWLDADTILKLSRHNAVPIILALSMCIITYSKQNIKYTSSDEFHDILTYTLLVFAAIFLVFIAFAKSIAEKLDKAPEEKVNRAIEEAKLQKGQHYAGMRFLSEDLNCELEHFNDEVEKIGMDKLDHGIMQASYSLTLLFHEDNPRNVALRSGIYSYVADILEVQPGTVESNIGNALKKHWATSDAETLAKIKENYDGPISKKIGAPTPRDFLIYMVENAKTADIKYNKKAKKLHK